MHDIFVFGASGHGKVVIDGVECSGKYKVAFVVDDAAATIGASFLGYPLFGREDALIAVAKGALGGIVAIGDNRIRSQIAAWITEHGAKLVTVVHPSATLARNVTIGRGTVVMAGCVVNSATVIGENVILNTGAVVDHDCVVGDGVHIAPGCTICGGVAIGSGALLGAGATVIPGVRIGAGALVGAGSTVINDVPDGARVAGAPARAI